MNAYDKIYLEDAMHNLAVMMDYGTMKEGDAARSGISLRMIQAYEQDRQDISRAEALTLIKLSKVLLCCEPEDLIAHIQNE